MTRARISWSTQRRLVPPLLGVLALWLTHRATGHLATRPLHALSRGYTDSELLAPGGDLLLELVRVQEPALRSAIATAGLWLLLGRVPAFLASFYCFRAAFALAWTGPAQARPAGVRPLHLAWSLLLVLAVTLTSGGLFGALLFSLYRLRRWLVHAEVGHGGSILALSALGMGLVWATAEVFFDLYRTALAGARLGPLLAARAAARAVAGRLLGLVALRMGLALAMGGVTVGAVLLLPAVTRGGGAASGWAVVALDVGLLGALCFRTAWLTWSSAHLPPAATPDLRPVNVEGAPPSEALGVPADPSPDPDA